MTQGRMSQAVFDQIYVFDRFQGRIAITHKILVSFGFEPVDDVSNCNIQVLDLRGDSANAVERIAQVNVNLSTIVICDTPIASNLFSMLDRYQLIVSDELYYDAFFSAIAQLEQLSHKYDMGLHGNSPHIQELKHQIRMLSHCDSSVLILGESGTGKEVAARAIHDLSSRASEPFVGINCAAIPAELLEAELFGHEKGAFTGAHRKREGRFSCAGNGTIFLDEVGDMPLAMQAKLLRVLQEGVFEPIGASKSVPTHARVIAATHQNLEQMVAQGTFRQDLYYRLNVVPIQLQPLRERPQDIVPILRHLSIDLRRQGLKLAKLSPQIIEIISRYRWPGNVRELANFYERMAVLYGGRQIEQSDLPSSFADAITTQSVINVGLADNNMNEADASTSLAVPSLVNGDIDLKSYLEEIEMALINEALELSDGVVSHAAKRLTLRRTTLIEKMRKHSIERL